jgi:hypothetical protein
MKLNFESEAASSYGAAGSCRPTLGCFNFPLFCEMFETLQFFAHLHIKLFCKKINKGIKMHSFMLISNLLTKVKKICKQNLVKGAKRKYSNLHSFLV